MARGKYSPIDAVSQYRELLPKHLRSYATNQAHVPIEYLVEDFPLGKYDFDVYLEGFGFNLQRPYVWTPEQQASLIESVFMERDIPPITVAANYDKAKKLKKVKQVWEVIDGKQRLLTLIKFAQNEFALTLPDGSKVKYKQMSQASKRVFNSTDIAVRKIIPAGYTGGIADSDKLMLFKYINFVGTPQSNAHIQKIQEALDSVILTVEKLINNEQYVIVDSTGKKHTLYYNANKEKFEKRQHNDVLGVVSNRWNAKELVNHYKVFQNKF